MAILPLSIYFFLNSSYSFPSYFFYTSYSLLIHSSSVHPLPLSLLLRPAAPLPTPPAPPPSSSLSLAAAPPPTPLAPPPLAHRGLMLLRPCSAAPRAPALAPQRPRQAASSASDLRLELSAGGRPRHASGSGHHEEAQRAKGAREGAARAEWGGGQR
jgi:hypothetical protein